MRDWLVKQAKSEYVPRQRMAVLAAAGVLVVIIVSLAILRLGGRLDRALQWPVPLCPPVNAIAGGLMAVAGWLLAIRTIHIQFTVGRGTPVRRWRP